MKKKIAIIIIMLVVLLVGCSKPVDADDYKPISLDETIADQMIQNADYYNTHGYSNLGVSYAETAQAIYLKLIYNEMKEK